MDFQTRCTPVATAKHDPYLANRGDSALFGEPSSLNSFVIERRVFVFNNYFNRLIISIGTGIKLDYCLPSIDCFPNHRLDDLHVNNFEIHILPN